MQSYFVDYKPQLAGVTFELYGRILTAIHRSIVEGADLAADWPEWREDRGGFGKVMRVFGEQESLDTLNRHLTVLIERRAIRAERIKQVPKHATAGWVYSRSRAADRAGDSRMRRLERRALERGEVFVPASPAEPRQACLHALPMQSISTGNRSYRLDIFRQPAREAMAMGGKSYGLGRPVPRWEDANAQ